MHWICLSTIIGRPSQSSRQWPVLRAGQALAARHYRASAFFPLVGLDTLTACRTDLPPSNAQIVAATQIESSLKILKFLFLNTENDERRSGDLTALETANVVPSSLPRDRLALVLECSGCAPLRENTPALSCTHMEHSRSARHAGKRQPLIVELLVFARSASITRKGSIAENRFCVWQRDDATDGCW